MSKVSKIEEDKKKIIKLQEENEDLKRTLVTDKKILKRDHAVRDLKIFGSAMSLLVPFCIAGSIISTSLYFLGAGLPFKKDEEKNYKKYTYECEDGEVEIIESYTGGTNFDYNYGATKFDLYYDWKLDDEKYTRIIKSYKETNLSNMNLYNSIIDKNIEYIESNCVPQKETIQETNDVELVNKDNGIKIEGIVTCVNKDEYLLVQESDLKNKYTTFLASCLTILIGLIANRNRRKKIKENIKHEIIEYKHKKEKIFIKKRKIIENENKILALGKWVNKNEKK